MKVLGARSEDYLSVCTLSVLLSILLFTSSASLLLLLFWCHRKWAAVTQHTDETNKDTKSFFFFFLRAFSKSSPRAVYRVIHLSNLLDILLFLVLQNFLRRKKLHLPGMVSFLITHAMPHGYKTNLDNPPIPTQFWLTWKLTSLLQLTHSGINNLQPNAKLFLYRPDIWSRALPGWNLTWGNPVKIMNL